MYKSISEIGISENKNQDQYSVLELVNDDQKAQLLNSHKVVLVDVFADWCGPCKQIAPSYALLAMKYAKPTICAVVKQQYDNVEEEIKNKIQGIPLFLFYEYGNLIDTVVGGDLTEVEKKLESVLSRVISESNLTKEQSQDVSIGQVPPQYKSNIRNSRGNMPSFNENYQPSMHTLSMPSQSNSINNSMNNPMNNPMMSQGMPKPRAPYPPVYSEQNNNQMLNRPIPTRPSPNNWNDWSQQPQIPPQSQTPNPNQFNQPYQKTQSNNYSIRYN